MMKIPIQGQLQLFSKKEVARETLELDFEVQHLQHLGGNPFLESFSFLPGQFVSLAFGEKSWRAYSIASTPEEKQLKLLVRLVKGGVASEIFRKASLGDGFPFKGSFGHFTLSKNKDAPLVFCATGTGIAPFRSMILWEMAQAHPRPMHLFYGGRDGEDIAYLSEITTWSPHLNVDIGLSQAPSTIQNTPTFRYHNSRITPILESTVFDSHAEFYICGNGGMVLDVQKTLLEKGIEKGKIFLERFN